MKKGILIIAHGSPKAEANTDFTTLVAEIQKSLAPMTVSHAFLDCAEPSIPQALDRLMASDHTFITILPYFLFKGKHTQTDIPHIVKKYQDQHPAIQFEILESIGENPLMKNWILNLLKN